MTYDQFLALSKKTIIAGVLGVVLFFAALSSAYTVNEGNVGIIKRFGEAVSWQNPGLHFKVPFTDSVTEIDTRTRKYKETMQASTTGKVGGNAKGKTELQMPSTITISANWSIPKTEALNIYKEYGGLEEYEDKILDPRVIKATKSIFAKHSVEFIISNRELVTNEIVAEISKTLVGHRAKLSDINIEDVLFPPKIKSAIEKKQTAKLEKEAEEYALQKQNLTAQRVVNTANADKEAAVAKADGQAYKIEQEAIAESKAISLKGNAEAEAIRAKAKALKSNPLIVELTKAQNWNGQLPTTVMGEGQSVLMDMRTK